MDGISGTRGGIARRLVKQYIRDKLHIRRKLLKRSLLGVTSRGQRIRSFLSIRRGRTRLQTPSHRAGTPQPR